MISFIVNNNNGEINKRSAKVSLRFSVSGVVVNISGDIWDYSFGIIDC
jgi:hypothetical protein